MTAGGAAAPAVPGSGRQQGRGAQRTFALVGNPNAGKTTLFNALTGLHQKVGNYAGVTVERKQGTLSFADGSKGCLIDLPGLYSLTPHAPDEEIARDVLLGYRRDTPRPDAIINVVDASNLERNLYLTSQLLDLGLPIVVVLTMSDTAARRGVHVDAHALEQALGVPVRSVVASRNQGIAPLREAIAELPNDWVPPDRRWKLPPLAEQEVEELSRLLQRHHDLPSAPAFAEALTLLGLSERDPGARWAPPIYTHLAQDHEVLRRADLDLAATVAEARYRDVERIAARVLRRDTTTRVALSDTLDRVFLHRFWGYVVFAGLMVVVFQAMFSWAGYPQGWIEQGVDALNGGVTRFLPPGDLRSLLTDGVISGVGNTLVFLPQILLLFFLIALLEDTGYMARAAFLMDRLMSRVGLHGKSFIPLLSSYACAIPGIMATRTIDSPRARLLTILVAPLMSCSARLPVYALMIGAFIPATRVLGVFNLQALTLLGMYTLGTVAAFGMAALFNRTLPQNGPPPSLLLEMPPYRLPQVRTVVFQMAERAWLFVRRAGTVILALTIVLWFLASYPKLGPDASTAEQTRHSWAGRLGQAIEPVIAPLGFDWKMGIGLIASFAAREVFVSAMGVTYNVDEATMEDEARGTVVLGDRMRADRDPRTGEPTFTPLVAVALMVYYVLAMQCISTIAVVRRETNGWKWPLFQVAYMTALAWVVTFVVYQGGRALGLG